MTNRGVERSPIKRMPGYPVVPPMSPFETVKTHVVRPVLSTVAQVRLHSFQEDFADGSKNILRNVGAESPFSSKTVRPLSRIVICPAPATALRIVVPEIDLVCGVSAPPTVLPALNLFPQYLLALLFQLDPPLPNRETCPQITRMQGATSTGSTGESCRSSCPIARILRPPTVSTSVQAEASKSQEPSTAPSVSVLMLYTPEPPSQKIANALCPVREIPLSAAEMVIG